MDALGLRLHGLLQLQCLGVGLDGVAGGTHHLLPGRLNFHIELFDVGLRCKCEIYFFASQKLLAGLPIVLFLYFIFQL